MTEPTAVELLCELASALPDEAEDHALAALAALTDPSVAAAALVEQDILERIEAAKPHLVRGSFRVVEDPVETRPDGTKVTGSHLEADDDRAFLHCPDCTRGLRAIGGNALACITLPDRSVQIDTGPGDVVACGKER